MEEEHDDLPTTFEWNVMDVQVVNPHVLSVTFRDGLTGEVVFTSDSFGKEVFAPLADFDLFRQVYLDDHVVCWPGEVDLAPDAMYDDIRESGVMIV